MLVRSYFALRAAAQHSHYSDGNHGGCSPSATFWLSHNIGIFDCIGHADSMVRERSFAEDDLVWSFILVDSAGKPDPGIIRL
jgi:hypothetical protein